MNKKHHFVQQKNVRIARFLSTLMKYRTTGSVQGAERFMRIMENTQTATEERHER